MPFNNDSVFNKQSQTVFLEHEGKVTRGVHIRVAKIRQPFNVLKGMLYCTIHDQHVHRRSNH